MVNGLGVLGWGVGGIEAEAAMLGQPIAMLIPDVIGFKLTGKLREGVTATDLVLTVTQMLRKKGVVGKFVEFFGAGPRRPAARRPRHHRQHGARNTARPAASSRWTPVTIDYLRLSGRDEHRIKLAEDYAKAQGLWRDAGTPDPVFTDTLELDLSTVEPSHGRAEAAAGPRGAVQRRLRPSPRTSPPAPWACRATRRTSACRSRAPTTTSAMATW